MRETPGVSFIVPCYRLAHFLGDCIRSILSQTYRDFEVLIMDDCSPDNTAEVAASFGDCRIRYVRNEANLGHLQNYNKGIELSRGRYVWLISADDRLRCPYVLDRFVRLMDTNRKVGFVFCSGVGLRDGVETTILARYYFGPRDRMLDGRRFIRTALSKGLFLLSAAIMVRRECYTRLGLFPLDLPHQGDVYLWYLWALDYDVAYLAEPMVNYRTHPDSMMADFLTRRAEAAFRDETTVLWRIKRSAEQRGFSGLARRMEYFLGVKYARAATLVQSGFKEYSTCATEARACEDALRTNARTPTELRRLMGHFYAAMGDTHFWYGTIQESRRMYATALHENWRMPAVWIKLCLAWAGPVGVFARQARMRLRQQRFAT